MTVRLAQPASADAAWDEREPHAPDGPVIPTRAVGMTRWQARGAVVTQATVLAVVGLACGVPLGLALGRTLQQLVAGFTPLQYAAPLALLALLLVAPVAIVLANALAAWPGRQAARLRIP